MAQMHQVIGSILRDITQARVTSDLFSREMSRYYEQDALLRLFPIPRSEIQEIVMDLNFTISDVSIDPERSEEREARIDRIFDLYADLIATDIIENLKGPGTMADDMAWMDICKTFDKPEFRTVLGDKITDLFEAHPDLIIEEVEVAETKEMKVVEKIDDARDAINDIIDNLVYNLDDVRGFDEKYNILWKVKAQVSSGLRVQLEAMQHDLEVSLEAGKEYKVEVDVTTDKLQELPEGAISSVKITTSIRNYLWSQVEEKEGRPIRRLIPE